MKVTIELDTKNPLGANIFYDGVKQSGVTGLHLELLAVSGTKDLRVMRTSGREAFVEVLHNGDMMVPEGVR